MIISASRRTDIPRYHFDWLSNRLQEGFALVRNPMNRTQVSRVSLAPEDVDCIAFWTKDPAPLLDRLAVLDPYQHFVQFTLNAYGNDIERGLPPKASLIGTFRELAHRIGPERMIWRYSPVLLSEDYTVAHHLKYFELFARKLEGSTARCRISFLDRYPKIAPVLDRKGLACVPAETETALARSFAAIGAAHGIDVGGCGSMDLAAANIERFGCIDADYVSQLLDAPLTACSKGGKRGPCACMQSVDIGTYNTCANGCVYCYANQTGSAEARGLLRFDPASPMLCDTLGPQDIVTERHMPSCVSDQLSIF